MPTYVVSMNWTDQGVRTDKESVHRREHSDTLAEKHGARIEQVYSREQGGDYSNSG